MFSVSLSFQVIFCVRSVDARDRIGQVFVAEMVEATTFARSLDTKDRLWHDDIAEMVDAATSFRSLDTRDRQRDDGITEMVEARNAHSLDTRERLRDDDIAEMIEATKCVDYIEGQRIMFWGYLRRLVPAQLPLCACNC